MTMMMKTSDEFYVHEEEDDDDVEFCRNTFDGIIDDEECTELNL